VHDPHGLFEPKETDIARRLAADGACVHPRARDDTVQNKTNPDAMVRTSPHDPGTVTEFKTPDSMSSTSVQRCVLTAARQMRTYGGGDVVIDGRPVGLTDSEARRGYGRAAGQARTTGQPMPRRVRIILADNTMITLPEK